MSRAPDDVWGAIQPPSGGEPTGITGEPPPEGGVYLPQRVACYVCHATTRSYVLVAGTSYCLDHAPRPQPQEPR